jgi:hypothetical protein
VDFQGGQAPLQVPVAALSLFASQVLVRWQRGEAQQAGFARRASALKLDSQREEAQQAGFARGVRIITMRKGAGGARVGCVVEGGWVGTTLRCGDPGAFLHQPPGDSLGFRPLVLEGTAHRCGGPKTVPHQPLGVPWGETCGCDGDARGLQGSAALR